MHRITSPRFLPLLASLILLLHAHAALALGTPFMVKDINPGPGSSNPQEMLAIGNQLFFGATNGTSGVEPMASGGTAPSTIQLRDINPGALSGITQGCPTCNAIVSGSTVFFSATTGVGGSTLWRTDGTPGGTVSVYPGASAGDLVDVGGVIYFSGMPSGLTNGFLFKSDGSGPGTSRVSPSIVTSGSGMVDFGGAPFFSGGDPNTGFELCTSDGTEPGTVVVTALVPGSGDSNPALLTQVGSALYFSATNGTGPGLCVSNGSGPGTTYLKQVRVGGIETDRGQLVNLNGTALFIGDDAVNGFELWRSDGTSAGTVLVKDVFPGSRGGLEGSSLVVMGGAVYFAADDGVHAKELWKSDGTASGTVLVKDIDPEFGAFGPSSPAELANIRGTLFFRATAGGTSGTQVWISNGTAAGTVSLADIYPGGASQAASFTEVNGTVYFAATDGVHGIELWAVSGLTVGVEPRFADSGRHPTLSSIWPNPVRSTTRIAYTLPSAQRVRLRLFDMLGRAVRTLEDGELASGPHEAELDARGLPSGVYFCRLETPMGSQERKVLLTR